MSLSKAWKWIKETAGKANDYSSLIKTGISALSTYASYKDQKRKNELQQQAYGDYMKAAEAAGQEAEAAIDLNLTPMAISGVPTTKADITDFTAVAAKGGLMSIPNKQRKRYAYGTDDDDVMEFDEEVLTPFDLEKETGLDLSGEQVKYNTANPREGAWNVWNSGGIDQEIYEFDFEIFFDSGDWMDMLKGQAPAMGNMQMASAPNPMDERNSMAQMLFGKPLEMLDQMELEQLEEAIRDSIATGGIAGLRHGGRPGYASGTEMEKNFYVEPSRGTGGDAQTTMSGMAEEALEQIYKEFNERFPNIYNENISLADMIAMIQADEVVATEGLGILGLDRAMGMINPQSAERSAQRIMMGDTRYGDFTQDNVGDYGQVLYEDEKRNGGRIGYRFGNEVIADQEAIVKTPNEEVVINDMEEIKGQTAGPDWYIKRIEHLEFLGYDYDEASRIAFSDDEYYAIVGDPYAKGGRAGYRLGDEVVADTSGIGGLDGMLNLGGMEKDYRFNGGFVPIGEYEKKDDVPARLSKNEFVFTADAVRAAGGGSINKGAQRMYDTMKNLEARPDAKRMTA
jgi:hypothetical protein